MSRHLTMDDVMAKVPALPALPQIVRHILESLANESVDLDSLGNTIASDPAVAVRLLAAANSGIFGGQKVASLRQAMMLLGIGRVKQITLATAIIDRYRAPMPFDVTYLWRHSLAVAICAQDLARHAGIDPEVAYIAGLLHDIGQLLLFAADPVGYADVLNQRVKLDQPLSTIERSHLGLDHAHVGSELARRWNLPADIVEAIGRHHYTGDELPEHALADVVHVATVLSHALDLGNYQSNAVPPVSTLAIARLGIDWADYASHFPVIAARYDGALLTLGL
jgi:putative nucleotidyltransferase with HDIG domain